MCADPPCTRFGVSNARDAQLKHTQNAPCARRNIVCCSYVPPARATSCLSFIPRWSADCLCKPGFSGVACHFKLDGYDRAKVDQSQEANRLDRFKNAKELAVVTPTWPPNGVVRTTPVELEPS